MRRSRFAKAISEQDGGNRASVDEAAWFDLRSPESSDEMSLASWRVASLEHAPVLLFATRVLIGSTCVALNPQMALAVSLANPAIALAMVLALDVAAFLGLRWRGTVRWAQSAKFGIQFSEEFDLARLAPKKERRNEFTMLRPWYVDQREAG